MTNLSKNLMQNILDNTSKAAPFALLLMAVGTFLIVGIFWGDYYTELFSARFPAWAAVALAVFTAVIKEGVRFALLISSIRDFSDKRSANGWLGLIASVALVAYEIKVSAAVAAMWATQGFPAGSYRSFLIFTILLGLILEIRLILTTPSARLGKPTARTNGQLVTPRAWTN